METFNVELKLTVEEAKKIAELLDFNVGVQQGLIDHAKKRIAESDNGHGNPKAWQQERLHNLRGEHKQFSYLLGVINIAIKDAQERTSEPF